MVVLLCWVGSVFLFNGMRVEYVKIAFEKLWKETRFNFFKESGWKPGIIGKEVEDSDGVLI